MARDRFQGRGWRRPECLCLGNKSDERFIESAAVFFGLGLHKEEGERLHVGRNRGFSASVIDTETVEITHLENAVGAHHKEIWTQERVVREPQLHPPQTLTREFRPGV